MCILIGFGAIPADRQPSEPNQIFCGLWTTIHRAPRLTEEQTHITPTHNHSASSTNVSHRGGHNIRAPKPKYDKRDQAHKNCLDSFAVCFHCRFRPTRKPRKKRRTNRRWNMCCKCTRRFPHFYMVSRRQDPLHDSPSNNLINPGERNQ